MMNRGAKEISKFVRWMSVSSTTCSKLFVGGLSFDTNEASLKNAFSQYGEIVSVNVICDRTTGKSKGFGFVKFSSDTHASAALQKLNGQTLDGRNIRVEYANKE
ncbi:hypothetical protein LUZ60_004083 [Juncus effusus]|nr:hypothetical protein LUZ60_004083 [Juncus effusus]